MLLREVESQNAKINHYYKLHCFGSENPLYKLISIEKYIGGPRRDITWFFNFTFERTDGTTFKKNYLIHETMYEEDISWS